MRRKAEWLTEADIARMRALRVDHGLTFKQLAERFNVHERLVREKLGKTARGEPREIHPACS